jgi:hypothetical protein
MTDDEFSTLRARVSALLGACPDALGVDGAGLSLARSGSIEPVLGTDATAQALEERQFVTGVGPCVDAATLGVAVLVDDLERPGGHADRWPGFLPEALALGIRAIFSLPLRVGPTTLGAVNLYRGTAGPLQGHQLARALAVADAVTLGYLDGVASDPLVEPEPLLSLHVHRAAGMVMVQQSSTIEEALVTLRATAFAEGVPVEELAHHVLRGTRRFEEEAR